MKWIEAVRTVCGKCKWSRDKCKTCPVIQMTEDHEAERYAEHQLDLLRNMTIKRVGNWFVGVIDGCSFQAKVTEEDSEWGISGGRIIKLFVTAMPNGEDPGREEIISYERGWGTYPDTEGAEAIADALYKYFQQRLDDEVPQ